MPAVTQVPDGWLTPTQAEAWLVAGGLGRKHPDNWTVVGGQMVQYHAWARGRPPSRQTNDMDCGVAARADSKLFARLTESLQTMGFQPVLHEAAHEYSWRRPSQRLASATVQVDLLLPTGLAADRHLSSTGSTGFASAGVQQATDRSERRQLRIEGIDLHVNVPSLLGAMVAKAAAVKTSGGRPGRHMADLQLLCELAEPEDLSGPLRAKELAMVENALRDMVDDSCEVRLVMAELRRVARQQQRRQSGQASGPARGRSVPGTNSGSFKAQPHSNPGQLGL